MNVEPSIHTYTNTQMHKNIDESDEGDRDASIIANNVIIINPQLTITYMVLDVQVRTLLCQSYNDVLVTL